MKITQSMLRQAITQVVQPMSRGQFVSQSDLRTTLKDVIPFGTHDAFVRTQPFGMSSYPGGNVFHYILNLYGDRLAPIIIADQHNSRPLGDPGSTFLYSTNAAGTSIISQVQILPGGDIILIPGSTIKLGSDSSSEPLVLGDAFKTLYNAHTHIGNLGAPSGTPMVPMSASEVSTKSFTEL